MIDYHKVTNNISINLLIFNQLTSCIATFFIHFKTASYKSVIYFSKLPSNETKRFS